MGAVLDALTLGTATPQKPRPRVPSNLERARAEGIPLPRPRDVDIEAEEPQFAFSSRIDSAFRVGKNQLFSIMDQPSGTRELLRPTISRAIPILRPFSRALSATAQTGEEALKLMFAAPMAVFASAGELINQFVEKKAPAKPGVSIPRGGAGEEIFEGLRDAFIQISLATGLDAPASIGASAAIRISAASRAKKRADAFTKQAREKTANLVAEATTEDAASAALRKGQIEKKIIDLESETMEFFGGKISTQEIVESSELFQPGQLNIEIVQKILETSKQVIRELGSDPTGLRPQRVFQVAKGLVRSGQLNFGDLFLIAETNGVTPIQLAELYGARVSEAGRILQEHSVFQKQLFRSAKTSEKAREAARATVKSEDEFNARMRDAAGRALADANTELPGFLVRTTNRFRSALVTQLATAVRNAYSQTGRIGLDIADRALQKALMKVFTPDAPRVNDPILVFGELTRMVVEAPAALGRRVLTGKKTAPARRTKGQIDALIAAFPKGGINERLFTSFLSDAAINVGRAPTRLGRGIDSSLRFTNSVNIFQEKMIRSAVFATDLDRRLQGRGLSLRKVIEEQRFDALTTSDLAGAIDRALEVTFAQTPSARATGRFERLGASYIRVVNDFPPLAIVGETFPRFFFNATKHINDFMPTGGLKAFTAKEKFRMANGDFSAISRGSIGTGLLGFSYLLRTGQIPGITPGEQWDEIILADGKVASLKAFAPLLLPHLFTIDLTLRATDDRFQGMDFREFREGLLGSSTRAQNSLAAVGKSFDFLTGINDEESYKRFLGLMAGDIAAGFLTPLRQINDFMQEFGATWNERFSQIKSTRRDILAPAQRAIPGGPQGDILGLESTTGIDITDPLPNFESPTREDDLKVPQVDIGIGLISGGVFKQITGITVNSPKNVIEQELDFLGFRQRSLSAKTGNKRVDQVVHSVMGPILELVGGAVVSAPSYKSIEDNRIRIKIVNEVIKLARGRALEAVNTAFPEFKLQRQLDRTPEIDRDLIDLALEDYELSLADLEARVAGSVNQRLKDLGQ